MLQTAVKRVVEKFFFISFLVMYSGSKEIMRMNLAIKVVFHLGEG